jgi:hypothetical protein
MPDDEKGTDGQVHLEGERNLTCLCGLVAAAPAELDAHFAAVFTPADAIGRDGKKHHPMAAINDLHARPRGQTRGLLGRWHWRGWFRWRVARVAEGERQR